MGGRALTPSVLRCMLCVMKNVACIAIVLALFLAAMSGCAPAPEAPRYYSISREFNAEEAATLRAAVAAWCAEAGACPEEALFSENAHFELVDDLPEDERTVAVCPEGATCATNGKEGGGDIQIARNRAAPERLDILWRIAAHEFGHLCIDGHRAESSLMSAYQDHEGVLEIDNEAVQAWKDGCGE